MANLKYGSTGDDVKRLQEQLGIKADGIYGAQTEAAVRQYQQNNGLAVDGIAGSQTLGSLNSGNTSSSGTSYSGTGKQAQYDANYDPTYEGNGPGVYGNSAYNQYAGAYNASGGVRSDIEEEKETYVPQYTSQYKSQIDSILAGILGYGNFAGQDDELYKTMYANAEKTYTQNAQKAMQNAMANAAALNGGYGSSYVQTAGQQAYNDYMTGLNDVSNQLLELAYGQWQDKLNAQYQQLSALRGLDSDAFSQWQQNYSNKVAASQYRDQMASDYLSDATSMAASGIVPTIYQKYLDADTYSQLTDLANQVKASSTKTYSGGDNGSSTPKKSDGTAWKSSMSTDDDPEAGLKSIAQSDYDAAGTITNKSKTMNGNKYYYVDGFGWCTADMLVDKVNNGSVTETVKNNKYTYTKAK